MDALYLKIPLKWMIWGYPYLKKKKTSYRNGCVQLTRWYPFNYEATAQPATTPQHYRPFVEQGAALIARHLAGELHSFSVN